MGMSLEDFAMKPSYGRLTGVSIACHAVQDAYLLLHVGVGCKNKVTHLLAHDWEVPCNLRQGWTEVCDEDLIMGSSRRIGPYLRSWQERMDSGWVCVVSVLFIELTGEDIRGEVRRSAEGWPVPVDFVDALGVDGDEVDGYASVVAAIARRVPWQQRPSRPRQVSLVGYWFDRYEGDHAGNLGQIAGMLKSIGASLGPVLLSGRRFDDHQAAADSGLVVVLPYVSPAEGLGTPWKTAGRESLATDLPMGIAGTSRWLRAVGGALGLPADRVEASIRMREERVRKPLAKMVGRWRGLRVAVLADVPMAVGMVELLTELGCRVVWVGLRGTSLGGRAGFDAARARAGLEPLDAEVVERPSLSRIRAEVGSLLAAGQLQGVIGSATELGPLRSLPREDLGEAGPFLLELGFPCRDFHCLTQVPFMGYGGVVAFAQRLLTAPRLWDDGRPAPWSGT